MSTSYEVKWPDYAAATAAVSFIALLGFSGDLMLGAMGLWPLAVLGVALIGIGAWKYRNRWLLLLLPVFMVPYLPLLALLYSCAGGNCL